ncbi:hypothetical protein BDN72DRAFT_846498 [Pluteus cervinus]|uniref:Uncharacterized protein n=1 Tax=Pluteus cervinus TaxID=181527 RepID=A0ACD3AFS0_9AGAR|nr:hypothetical protein BDN72DRAFT_846498 [Pluteus cervinus]
MLTPGVYPPSGIQLCSFPEELLERILSLCVLSSTQVPPPPRPTWHRRNARQAKSFPSPDCIEPHPHPPTTSGVANSTVGQNRGRTAPLYVNKLFHRIATPLFYHTIHVTSRHQAHLLRTTLVNRPPVGAHVQRISGAGVWKEMGEVFRLCDRIRALDLTIDDGHEPIQNDGLGNSDLSADEDGEAFFDALDELKGICTVALRKSQTTYLTQPRPRYRFARVAQTVSRWNKLESMHIAFRLSEPILSPLQSLFTPSTSPPSSTATASSIASLEPTLSPNDIPDILDLTLLPPIQALMLTLVKLPSLHTVSTLTPSLWTPTLLGVSRSQSLKRIILRDSAGHSTDTEGSCWFGIVSDNHRHSSPSVLPSSPAQSSGLQPISMVPHGLFMMEARKHVRLIELIKEGTPNLGRARALTIGTQAAAGGGESGTVARN